MYDLPAHLQALIYSYDATYRECFALVLLQLHLVFTGWVGPSAWLPARPT